MTTTIQWHKAEPTDLPALTEGNGDYSPELLFICKEADFGSYYREGYFDRDTLRFYARGTDCSYILGEVRAWAYLPDEEQLIKTIEI